MLIFGNGSGLFNTNRIPQTTLAFWVVDVEAGNPAHLLPV